MLNMATEAYDIVYANAAEPLPIPGGRRFYEFHKPLARKFRILYLQPYTDETERERIAKILGDAGISVDFLRIATDRRRSSTSFLAFRLRAIRSSLSRLKKLANHVKIVHEEASPYPLLSKVFAGVSRPTVLTINELRGPIGVKMLGLVGLGEYAAEKMLKVFPNSYDLLITVSPSIYEITRRFAGNRNTVLVSNGVDTQKFSPGKESGKNENGTLRIVSVGRLMKHKVGLLPVVARIMNRIAVKHNFRIVYQMIGRGPLEGMVRRLAENSQFSNVRFDICSDFITDQRYVSILRESDLCMHLNPYMEGFGFGVAEAMSCKVPVVAFDIPGIRDVVQDGSSGFLVQPFDLRSLYSKLDFLLTHPDLLDKMGSNGRTRIVAKFSIEKKVQQLGRLYETLLHTS
jgi:glycosyltransferase involved in cell wall biosynthesis